MLADRRNQTPIKVLYETKDTKTLIDDILERKRDVDYKAKYVIAKHSTTTRQRPQEFNGGFEDWLYDVKASNRKAIKEEKNKEKIFDDFMVDRFKNVDKFLKKFTTVY